MFWGVTIRTDKPHRESVTMPFHISMAALVWDSEQVAKDKKLTSVILKYEGKDYVLCTLEYGKVMCVPLDLVFDKGEKIGLHVMGSGSVHLSGFMVTDDYSQKDSSESSTDEYKEYDSLSSEDTYSSSSERESESESIESTSSSSDDTPPKQKKDLAKDDRKLPIKKNCLKEKAKTVKDDCIVKEKVKEPSSSLSVNLESSSCNKKSTQKKKDINKLKVKNENEESILLLDSNENRVSENAQNDFNKENQISKVTEEESLTISKSDNKDAMEVCRLSVVAINSSTKFPKITLKEKEAVKRSSSVETKAVVPVKKKKRKSSMGTLNSSDKASKESMGKDLKSNVDVLDIKVGNGPVARKGKLVHVCYVGYLSNGEEFSSVRNRPFSFRLGSDTEVVKGLDSGIEGMKVGGKRKIVIPPSEGFGNKTVGSVPPNSTLTYEVELKAVS